MSGVPFFPAKNALRPQIPVFNESKAVTAITVDKERNV